MQESSEFMLQAEVAILDSTVVPCSTWVLGRASVSAAVLE